MTFALVFDIRSHLWDAALGIFVVVPLMLGWIFSLVDTVRRHDLSRRAKVFWLALLAFLPLAGTAVYLIRRTNITATPSTAVLPTSQVAATIRDLGAVTDNLATTMFSAQLSLAQGASIVREVGALLTVAGGAMDVTVPLVGLRPFEDLHDDVVRLGVRCRNFGASLDRTAVGLGTNAADLRKYAGDIQTLASGLDRRGGASDASMAARALSGAVALVPGTILVPPAAE